MAYILKNKASASLNKAQPSSFYISDKPNPVLQALEQERNQFVSYMKKRTSPDYEFPDGEPISRPADILFELWNKYEPRLPKLYYKQKIIEMGDFLISIGEHKLALWQCYERYLQHYSQVNVEEITEVDVFCNTFFPGGFDAEDARYTFRALMGKSVSMYEVVRHSDPKLQSRQSVDRCIHILDFLQLVMQVILPRETLCWLVFNGTVHIYSISRHMMSLGYSSKVLEFLLWAAMCMEMSVPLLAVKYLSWRATLYTAVCQCYYDCKAGQQAEAFARRGLSKINELSQLESLSCSAETSQKEYSFRQATVRMALMVFKRAVFETRRKPKGVLRPKTRANLKDSVNMPWPRTPTEKMLADMFEGGSAQFLAVLESLNDSNRRILLSSPLTQDNEPEILDVFAELFMAAQEILAGGGGNKATGSKAQMQFGPSPLSALVRHRSLIDMATQGEDGVPLGAAIRIVKLAYNYELWDVFDTLLDPILLQIKEEEGIDMRWEEKSLELLQAMVRFNSSHCSSKRPSNDDREGAPESSNAMGQSSVYSAGSGGGASRSFTGQDDLTNLADVLMSIVKGPFQQDKIEIDMVVDATLYLWSKCKAVFQKFQTGSLDNPRYLLKMDNPQKWINLLETVHQALGWSGISSVDPILTAEVALRLAMVCESSALLETTEDVKSPQKESKITVTDASNTGVGIDLYANHPSLLSASARQVMVQHLCQARDILTSGLENVNSARQSVALNDGKSIADISWIKSVISDTETLTGELYPEVFQPDLAQEEDTVSEHQDESSSVTPTSWIPDSMKGAATSVWNTVKDLHMELIMTYHRVTLRLTGLSSEKKTKQASGQKKTVSSRVDHREKNKDADIETFEELVASCSCNRLSKALLYMQRALMLECNEEQKSLLDDAKNLIHKAQAEEQKTYYENTGKAHKTPVERRVPPPPILVCRTNHTMVFRPAPFLPISGQKVGWYRLFGRSAAGTNVKARMSDNYLPGTGDEVTSFDCELKVSGLTPNERYVFAVAAYAPDGTLIGEGVGDTTKPVLASHPLPVLTTWAYLSQICYQVGYYSVAQEACEVLWNHFLASSPPPERNTYITEAKRDFKLRLLKLNRRVVCLSSPVLLRQFLTSIFVNVDSSVRIHGLFSDVLCDQGLPYLRQVKRLKECEKMLVAIELAGWLNEANLALQAVVQCYGLLAPLLYYKIPAVPVIQVLQHCHAVLQEIPPGLFQKRQSHVTAGLHHMTACITYYLAKVLRMWGQKQLANSINEAGRRLLSIETEKDLEKSSGAATSEDIDVASTSAAAPKKKGVGGSGGSGSGGGTKAGGAGAKKNTSPKEEEASTNEELRALEANMLKASRAARAEHELSGTEDPVILHAYIAYLPSKIAYREVVKFKRRNQFLEFFVYSAQKGLSEGEVEAVIEWCKDANDWLEKRNEAIIGPRAYMSKQTGGAVTFAGDDPKKFAAAMAEYSKKDSPSPPVKDSKGKDKGAKTKQQQKYKPIRITSSMSDAARQAQEEKELKAIGILSTHLPDLYHYVVRKRRLRKITRDEMPWRCQMNMVQALCHFGALLQKLEKREKLLGSSSSNMYKTGCLDPEWFTLETAGTLVVGWEGCPTHHLSGRRGDEDETCGSVPANLQALDLATDDRPKTTGIEFAAAAATGADLPPLYHIPPEVEDTPRTYRSDKDKEKITAVKTLNPDTSPLSTKATIEALEKTFRFFKCSMTLAYRGQHWTLLQNGARALWNCLHTAILRAVTLVPEGQEPGLVTMATLYDLVWHPLYMATDCLLDMLFILQNDLQQQAIKAKTKGHETGSCFESWMGSIEDERGGANLKFEVPLDDLSMVDARWVRRIVLRCLEMLYHKEKWEKLVDVALRFSALSNDRYAEQVVPLLVQAQHKVSERIASVGGPPVPQPHYLELQQRLGHMVSARDYMTAQLRLQIDPARTKLIQPGAPIDPLGHDAYSAEDAFRLSSVPLDISLTLATLRDVLSNSRYTARALQHSRKMLILYLAGQQNTADSISRQPSKVDFAPNKARLQPTVPPDLSAEKFLSEDDVQSSPIPRSHLGQVIMSYEKTIKMLLAKHQKGLAAQATQELGNIYYHANDIRAAYRCWAEALDLVLGITDAMRVWRQELQSADDISQQLLQRCGLWGCLTGGVLASNIAQYILTADLGLRMECCFLSGHFFKALFRASLPHPTSDRDYALYDVGEGCEVTNLVPGIDFLSDRFRCNGRSLAAALRWVTEELARGRHNLFVLPLLTLYQYFMTFVCRDLQRAVDGRILKVRVLTDLGLFSEALTVLQRLLYGERLPHTGDSSFRQVESRKTQLQFASSLPINDSNNLKVLEQILDKRLTSNLAVLFGPHLTCHLSLAQSHLFVALADTIPVLPAIDEATSAGTAQETQETFSTIPRGGLGSKTPKIPGAKTTSGTEDQKKDGSEDNAGQTARRFTDAKALTLEFIKGTLLTVADQIVTTISEVICENASHEKTGLQGLSAAELELVVQCRLEQSAIALQKHHAPLAARIIFSALKLLQNSNIFKQRKAAPPPTRPSSMRSRKTSAGEVKLVNVESNQFQYQNFQSRARLDARLWLNCRLALVRALNAEIRGMGEVKGPDNKVLTELAECQQYCREGLKEAEACGDVEVQAQFLMQGAQLTIMEGCSLRRTISLLDGAIQLLHKVPCLSVAGEEMLCMCIVLRTDLAAASKPDLPSDSPTQHSLQAYLQAQNVILAQMEALGERIEHHKPAGQRRHLSAPISPVKNTYSMQLLRLAQIKLRVGHAMARTLSKDILSRRVEESPVAQWKDCLGVLSKALELMMASARREANTEAEILLTMGKVQKMLVYLNRLQPSAAAATLLEAIRVAYTNDHDLGLIRQAYLELAQVFLHSYNNMRAREGTFCETEESGEKAKPSSAQKRKGEKSKTAETETDKLCKAAWVAIRCAAAAAKALRARSLLIGNIAVTTQKVASTPPHHMPDFASLDMMNAYVLGEKKKVFKNEIEEELAPLVEASEVKTTETYEDQVIKTRKAASDLSWIPLLGYQTILQRLVCTATIAASSMPPTGLTSENEELAENEFDLGFISRAQFYLGQNHDVVRNMLFAGYWCIRLNHIHHYLCATLPAYSSDCCAIYPPSSLEMLAASQAVGQGILSSSSSSGKSSVSNPCVVQDQSKASVDTGKLSITPRIVPPGSQMDPYKPSDTSLLSSSGNDVVMQWYQTSLAETDPSKPKLDPADQRLLLLYAVTLKGSSTQQSIIPGHLWVSVHKVAELHARLATLAQHGDITLVDKIKEPVTKETKSKKARLQPMSPKGQHDDQLEYMLRQCMEDCVILMGLFPGQESIADTGIPFEVSKLNLRSLEQLFHPALGTMVVETDLVQWVHKLLPIPQ